MRRAGRLLALGVVMGLAAAAHVSAQDPQAEKTLIASERAIHDAVAKANVAAFKQHVAADSWAIDSMTGRMATAEFVKGFDAMAKSMKLTAWDITDVKTIWASPTTAVLTYKWTGTGTYDGQPIPSPVWCSTVWAKRGDKWTAVFHQESAAMPAPAK